jgi:hypothetical protein
LGIKAGFIKIFVAPLDRAGQALTYLRNTFPILSEVTVKRRICRYERLCRIWTFTAF